ncbi:MAG TPA: hypothetical protein VGR24_00315 [bacterium]|nr:hypothetical protein [bacterium]
MVLISVMFAWVIVSMIIVGTLAGVSDDLRDLSRQKEYLHARYAADAGAAVILGLLAEERGDEVSPAGRAIAIGGGSVTFARAATTAETLEYVITGRSGRGRVTLDLVVARTAPHRVRSWAVRP